jgi:hypothetical protein
MTKHFIGTQAQCEDVQAAVDLALGYPKTVTKGLVQDKAPGLAADALMLTGQEEFVERFVPEVVMPTYAKVRKHPKRDEYAYPVSGVTDQAVLDEAVDLPEDWNDQGENED